ncbi:hypothetical protein Gotur_019228, partial [Gossypium turneri]
MARIPQMVMAFDLHPSLEYIQWYSSLGKPYLLGGQSTVVPPHMQRPGAYEPVADMEAEPVADPDPELDPEPEPEPEPKPEPDPEQSHSHGIHIFIIQLWRAMTIFQACQEANTIMSLISLDRTHRSTALPTHIH